MGLDMFIYRRNRGEEVAYWRKANAILKYIEDHVANGELENCKEYRMSKEDLIGLRDTCLRVLASAKLEYKEIEMEEYDFNTQSYVKRARFHKVLEDSSLAEELLPTQSGFFFGSTLYDESYVLDLKNTVEQINTILETTDFDEQELVFHAWW